MILIGVDLYDKKFAYDSYLTNAKNISFGLEENSLWTASFSLPGNDEANDMIEPLMNYIDIRNDWLLANYDGKDVKLSDGKYIGKFRVVDIDEDDTISRSNITYSCKHVLHLLTDSIIEGYVEFNNMKTREVLESLLSLQNTKDWVLDRCDFDRRFSYSWENENGLLDAIFSVPKSFDESYRFVWDDSVYPFKLSLIRPSETPVAVIEQGHNLKGLKISRIGSNVFNEFKFEGQGEEVNALNYADINGGDKFVRSQASINRLGRRISYQKQDKRFTIKEHLKQSAEALLDKSKDVQISWQTTALDVSKITGERWDNFNIGDVITLSTNRHGEQNIRIVKYKVSGMNENPGHAELDIGNVKDTFTGTLADIERQQDINAQYANGSTNLVTYCYPNDDVDKDHPFENWFYIEDDVVHLNTVDLTYKTARFRATSKANVSAGQTVGASTTSAGGGYYNSQTSSSNGGTSQSTSSGASGSHVHRVGSWRGGTEVVEVIDGVEYYNLIFPRNGADGNFYTLTNSGDHTHTVNINIAAHTHSINLNIPAHTHDLTFTVPGHTHEILYGIFENSKLPTKLQIVIDGTVTPYTSLQDERIDLIPYMKKASDGTYNGKHTLKIVPDDLARIEAQLLVRVFIQSKVGGQF